MRIDFLIAFSNFIFELASCSLFGWLVALAVCFWAVCVILDLLSGSRRSR